MDPPFIGRWLTELRRYLSIAILVGGSAAALVAVPRWTARAATARREATFLSETRSGVSSNLPPCPFAGPSRDAFLERSAATLSAAPNLWVPVCRIAPFPVHRILIITTQRAKFQQCAEGIMSRPANVMCALEEPLVFLADSGARRTWARRESGDVIWITSRSMAWCDHLVVEHRQWLLLVLLFPAALMLLYFVVRRTWLALSLRAACHGPDDLELPRGAEFLLHWVLGSHRRSLPGDLSEEYSWIVLHGFSRKDADAWYQWQVLHSLAPIAARRVESMLTQGLRRDAFIRRG